MKTIALKFITAVTALLITSTVIRAQCVVDFTYNNTGTDYHFQSTTNVLIDTAEYIEWSFMGPYLMGSSKELSPTFTFPVNGMYIVSFQIGIPGCVPNYKQDTIIVSGIVPTGTCTADFTYTPACCSQFQMEDQSIASDSILNYYWYGLTRDTFIQSHGLDTTSTIMSLWSYNCIYDYFYVTHAITTITGCQSVKIDTIHTYCDQCVGGMQADFTFTYESSTNTYYFHDASVNNSNAGYWHWGFVSAGAFISSTEQNPVIVNPPYPIQVASLEIMDTAVYCRQWKSDSIQQILAVGELEESGSNSLTAFQVGDSKWRIQCAVKGELQFRVFDLTGRKIFETVAFSNGEGFDVVIPVNVAGMYVASVQQHDVFAAGKIFKGY